MSVMFILHSIVWILWLFQILTFLSCFIHNLVVISIIWFTTWLFIRFDLQHGYLSCYVPNLIVISNMFHSHVICHVLFIIWLSVVFDLQPAYYLCLVSQLVCCVCYVCLTIWPIFYYMIIMSAMFVLLPYS